MIDSRPVSIFTKDDLKKMLYTQLLFVIALPKPQKSVNSNQEPLKFARQLTTQVEIKKIEKQGFLPAILGNSLDAQDQLVVRNCKITPVSFNGESEYV